MEYIVSDHHPKVVNLNTEDYDVYIGRGSLWGNPFKIGKDGTRSDVINKYENSISKEFEMQIRKELKGKRLGCFCKPKACHGDILLKIANSNPLPF